MNNTSATSFVSPSAWYTSAFYIGITCPALFCMIGVPLNVANIITVRYKSKMSSHFAYVTVLSAVDSLVLISRASSIYLPYTSIRMTSFLCATIQFLVQTSSQMSSWTLVFLCFERAMVVKFPFSRLTVFNSCRAAMSMGAAALVISLLNLFTFFAVQVDPELGVCAYKTDYLDMVRAVWYRVEALSFAFVPFGLLIIFNAIIVTSLHQPSSIHVNKLNLKKEKSTGRGNLWVRCVASFNKKRRNFMMGRKLGCLAFKRRGQEVEKRRRGDGEYEIKKKISKLYRQRYSDVGFAYELDTEKEKLVQEYGQNKGKNCDRSVSSFSLSALKELHALKTQRLEIGFKFIPNSKSYDCLYSKSIVQPKHFETLSNCNQNSRNGYTTVNDVNVASNFPDKRLGTVIYCRPKSLSTSKTDLSKNGLLSFQLKSKPISKSISRIDFVRENKNPRRSSPIALTLPPLQFKLQPPDLLQRPVTSAEDIQQSRGRTELVRVESQFQQIIKSTIIASLVFFVTTTPYCFVAFFVKLLRSSVPSHHSFVFLATFSVMLSDFNHVANFFIYSLRTRAVLRSIKSSFLGIVPQKRCHTNCCIGKRRGSTLLSLFKRSSFGSSGMSPLPVSNHTTLPVPAAATGQSRDNRPFRLARNVCR